MSQILALRQASCALAPDASIVGRDEQGGLRDMAPTGLNEEVKRALRDQIERLRQEHRDLDAAIEALTLSGPSDRLQLQRLKKRKLWLRDRAARLEDELTPDIIA